MKVIGLVGFFGWGNYGDELFLETYRQWLGDDFELRVLHDILERPYFSRPVEEVLADVDAIVIGGGDLVIPWTVSDLYWKDEYLERPVFVVGVGVPTWKKPKPGPIARMTSFFQHPNVKLIDARDMESRAWIEDNLNPSAPVTHSTDLVFSLDLPPREGPEVPTLGVVTRDRRSNPDDLTNVLRLCEKAASVGYEVHHLILATGPVGKLDLERAKDLELPRKQVVTSDSIWDLTKAIGGCSVLASMKFHGTVVAAAYGVPSIVMSPTDKSRNLLRVMERPELACSLENEQLPSRFNPYMASIPSHTRHFLSQRAKRTMTRLGNALREI